VLKSDGSHVLVLTGFSTGATGDLLVVLSDLAGQETSAPDGTHAVSIGQLKAVSGDQTYDLPSGIDVDAVKSVVIWNDTDGSASGAAPLAARG